LGLIVQYGDSTGAHTRTLAVLELKTTITGEELSKLIINVLKDDFDITMPQIYSITTENGSNALAAGKFNWKLLAKKRKVILITLKLKNVPN